MDEINEDSTIGEVFKKAEALANKAAGPVGLADALADGCKIGAFIVIQSGGFDEFDWEAHVVAEHDTELPMGFVDVNDFLMAEALLVAELIIVRQGFASKGVKVPDLPASLLARVGREQ